MLISNIFNFAIIFLNLIFYIKTEIILKHKISKFKIILEPEKKNTAPAILTTALINEIPIRQPMMILSADHLIGKLSILNNSIKANLKHLTKNNIFIFGIKPKYQSSEYGYFLTKKNQNEGNKFIEKPNVRIAKKILKKKGLWNAGMFYLTKESIIANYKKHQKNMFQ